MKTPLAVEEGGTSRRTCVAAMVCAAIALTLLAACGSDSAAASGVQTCSASTTFPASALSTVTTDSGKLRVAIHSAPYQPLIAGLECLELVVTDSSTGSTVDGLTISMTPWMPAMDHGASGTPQVTALGQGRYVFTNVSLFMAG